MEELELSDNYKERLDELVKTDTFERLKIFLYDFRIFPNYMSERLQYFSVNNPQYFMSLYYFTEDEISNLLDFQLSDGSTLKECIENQLNEKSFLGIICTSHDIYPIFINTFGLKKGFDSNLSKISKKFKGVIK